jgi:tripartite-type tricarboxylate transporter receptor subunit TctC
MTIFRRSLLAGLALPALAHAQPLFNRPIRLLVPFAAGGAADSAARAIAPRMGELLGQSLVVENRTGASGSIGGGEVARAPADGHTLLLDASSHIVNPSLIRGLTFDYATAFAPISLVAQFPQALAVKPAFPAATLTEFIAQAKERPGAITLGTQGNATAGHMGVLRLMQQAGIEVVHVPYRGGSDAARDLASGALDGVFITVLSARPVVESGRARFLAVANARRSALRPDVPTFAEAGLPGVELSEWVGLFTPAGTPAPQLSAIYAALTGALQEAAVRERLLGLGAEPVGTTPDDFTAFVARGREEMGAMVRAANVRLD